jgi:hypothetical protein
VDETAARQRLETLLAELDSSERTLAGEHGDPGELSTMDQDCAGLAAAYARLVEAIRASAARGDAEEEDRLRNRAQVALGQMCRLHCPQPDPADQGP